MSPLKIYFDEDAMDGDLVAALRFRVVESVTALDAGLIGSSDEDQLGVATEVGCSLYTFNVCDFYRLHTQWAGLHREHAGFDSGAPTALLGR